MTTTSYTSAPPSTHRAEKAITLALRLAHAENALLALSSGQVDAIIDPSGHTHLLRPAQEHLRQSERRLQAVFESIADVITVVNRGGVILSQNAAVTRVFGYEPEELVGSRIFELVHTDDLASVYSAFFNVIEGFDEDATAQFRHQIRDGSYRMIEATVGKLRDASPASAVFSLRPITNPVRERTELRRLRAPDVPPAGEDRDLATLAHRQRTPFMEALLGTAALEEALWSEPAKPATEMLWRKLEREAGPRLGSIDAHEVARSVVEACHREVAEAQVDVLLYLRADENMVQGDWARLLQIMCNLVKNAVESSTPGSTISIASANDAPGRLTFELADQGVGIDPVFLPDIFNSLLRGDLSNQQFHGSLRRDLNIARRLAEAQGGKLTVSSRGRGKGATFRLTLNTAPPPAVAPTIMPPEEPGALAAPIDQAGASASAVDLQNQPRPERLPN